MNDCESRKNKSSTRGQRKVKKGEWGEAKRAQIKDE